MAFKIMPYPTTIERRRSWGWEGPDFGYADHRDINQYFGFRPNQKVPAEFSGSADLVPLVGGGYTELSYTRGSVSSIGRRGKSSKHRVTARCPHCREWVPAGRTHQHKCR